MNECCPKCGSPFSLESPAGQSWACGSFRDSEGSHYQSRECVKAERDRLKRAVAEYCNAVDGKNGVRASNLINLAYAAMKKAAGVK